MSNVMLKERKEIEDKYKWRIQNIYSSLEEWESDFKILQDKAPNILKFNGKLDSGEELLKFLKFYEDVMRLFDKLFLFAHLKSDEDTQVNSFQALKNKIDSYSAELMSYSSFFEPEILSLDEDIIKNEINSIPELKEYEFYLENILKMKPHTLDKNVEKVLASVSDCLNAPSNIFSVFSDADLKFPEIKDEKGNIFELSEGNYLNLLKNKDRCIRKSAFTNLFDTYYNFKNTFGTTLTSSIKNFIFNSKIRNFNSSLESSLKPNNIPVEVYNNAIDTVNKHLDSLHRYVRIKKKLLNLDEIHMYDLYVPIVDTPETHIEFSDAVDMVKDGLKPLGKEYLDIFQNGIDSGWIDVLPNKGKRSGAYSWGCYDTVSYVLLNYNYGIGDVSTLAHEMGHSIHSYYSKHNNSYIYSNYVLFCAEVASTTNESLLIKSLIKNEKDKNKRLYFVNQELECIRTTIFRQLMFAEFEKMTHELIENGESLTSDDYCKIWHDLNLKYFGEDIIIDKGIDMEWARIPHFYNDFYVYQYATGYAAANSFSTMILNEGDKAVQKYKGFLKGGCSDYPINLLKKAGVDMTTSKPLEDAISRFDELLDMLEN